MQKCYAIIILMMCMVPLVSATTIFQISETNITWEAVTLTKWGGAIDETNNVVTVQNLDECTNYFFRAMDDVTSWKYTEERTECSGEKTMASLSIMIFVLAITGGLFLIPFLVNKFSKNELLNIILQHSFILLGLLFLTLDTTIALTISNVYGVGVDSEMRMFLWIISKTAYLGMFIAVIHFIFKSIKIMQIRATNKRMGYD